MGAALTAKAASDPMELEDLFGSGGQNKPQKTKKEKKVLSPEQELKKTFEKNMSMRLALNSQHDFETKILN